MRSRVIDCAGILLSAAGMGFSVSLIDHCAAFVLSRGGWVASGGPYVIASPAPEWIMLLMPGAVLLFTASIMTSIYFSERLRWPWLLRFAWSGVFLTIGYRFACAGAGGGEPIPGFIICAILFIIMGIAPLVWIPVERMQRRRSERKLLWVYRSMDNVRAAGPPLGVRAYWTCAVTGAVLGVVAGLLLRRVIPG